jgi:hypothetical protein
MKYEELVVRDFLVRRFQREPLREPLGTSTAPDFAIGKTAFEVRRLNQQYVNPDGSVEGLEKVDFSLTRALVSELDKIDFRRDTGSFFVTVSFLRPLHSKVGKIARVLAREARSYYSTGSRNQKAISTTGVRLQLVPSTVPRDQAFIVVPLSDDDSGGLIDPMYRDNIQFALKEKIDKTKEIATRYEQWVLVLVDFIMPGYSWMNDVGLIELQLGHFQCVVVVDQNGVELMQLPRRSLEVLTV